MKKQRENRSTIYDVAAEAGVSITTVSRYLNGSQSVRDKTASKIARAMEYLDYIPQGNAGSRAVRTFGRIGILTPFFPAPSFVERLEGLIPPLRQNNYEAVVYTIEGPDQLDEYLTSVPFTRRIDGLILISVKLSPEQKKTLEASGLKVVLIESDDPGYARVLGDDERGGRLAGELFLEKAYAPCVFMGEKENGLPYSCHPSKARQAGFESALAEGGAPLPRENILVSETTVEDAEKVFGAYLDARPCPRGVFAMSDLQAIGIMRAAKKRGRKVPEELAVLGFDNLEAADWLELSTISQHLRDSGRIAAGLLLDSLSGEGGAIQKINLQVCLIQRSTT